VIVLVMGVSGVGKTSVAEALAARTGWAFQEGDALHPPENVAKMAGGTPLDDADRAPWLATIAARIDEWRARGQSAVITCSALKRRYRAVLTEGRPDVRLVYLRGSHDLIGARLADRRGHFMPPGLLDSQFAALEEPTAAEAAIVVDVGRTLDGIVTTILIQLGS
jgi:carbohydrate kinase (thermoresistant glucokinase family)